ncbi:hypothetical protein [Synechococcus phage S-B68]|nr:hypothetical protein [Synechococcus phage S-B68]
MNYYTYAFLREDGTPYYIGKGKDRRCYVRQHRRIPSPPTKDRIIKLKENLTEEEAFRHEVYMISVLPNLRNLTVGGEGTSGYQHTTEAKQKMSDARIGRDITWGDKISQAKTGHSISEEHIKKLVASRVKAFTICSPTGKIVEVTNMTEFCRSHNLTKSAVSQVISGKRAHHKGWTAPN